MSKDKFDYLSPGQLYRFPFTTTSMQWGITIGALLACHKYSRTRTLHPGIWQDAVYSGVVSGMTVGAASWAYYMYQFTKQSHIVRRQTQTKHEQTRRTEYLKTYFRNKYNLDE